MFYLQCRLGFNTVDPAGPGSVCAHPAPLLPLAAPPSSPARWSLGPRSCGWQTPGKVLAGDLSVAGRKRPMFFLLSSVWAIPPAVITGLSPGVRRLQTARLSQVLVPRFLTPSAPGSGNTPSPIPAPRRSNRIADPRFWVLGWWTPQFSRHLCSDPHPTGWCGCSCLNQAGTEASFRTSRYMQSA